MLRARRVGIARIKGGGETVASFLAPLALSERGWWSYDLAKTRYLTTIGDTEASATDLTGLWLDRANWVQRGVVNILTRSQELNTGWSKRGTATVTVNADTAPDGTSTAELVEGLGAAGANDLYQGPITTGRPFTAVAPSFYLKKVSASGTLEIQNASSVLTGRWTIDLSAIGSGWERITKDHPAVTVVSGFGTIGTGAAGPLFSCSAGAPISCYIWGVQLEFGSVSTDYQAVSTLRGGPGNHAQQATPNSRPTLQSTGMRGDGADDSLPPGMTPGTVGTALVKAVIGAKGATRTLLGGTVGTARYMLAVDADGLLCAGIGTDAITTIKGGSDIEGKTGTAALVHDGAITSLYWREVGGPLQTIYGAAQNGAPGTDPIRLFATNSGGSAANFGNADIQHAVIAKRAATLSQIAAMTTELNALP